jgi:hypothetical protein
MTNCGATLAFCSFENREMLAPPFRESAATGPAALPPVPVWMPSLRMRLTIKNPTLVNPAREAPLT